MPKHDVYGGANSLDSSLYSEGVTRAFGENRLVTTKERTFLASVQPLLCDPDECNLIRIGTIEGYER